ncbi:MAG: hypothetical protein ACOVP4_09905 [Bacteriovoracaceae bacterium]
MITTKTRIAIIENNWAFGGLLKTMLLKIGVLSQYYFASSEKFTEHISKKSHVFDLVIFNCVHSDKSLIHLLESQKIKYVTYGEKEKITIDLINKVGLSHIMELPFTSDKLLLKLEQISS